MVETLPTATFPPVVSNAVEEAAAAFFRGPCGLTHVPDAEVGDSESGPGMMSTISFVGDLPWAFALALPEAAAVTIARAFAGFEIPFDSPDMGDVIGEIVNVIAGDVAGRLAKKGLAAQMSLPRTVVGSDIAVLVPSGSVTTRFTFAGPNGVCRFDLVSSPTAAPSAPTPSASATLLKMTEPLPTTTFPPVVSSAVEDAAAAFFRSCCGLTRDPVTAGASGESGPGIMSTISFVGDLPWAFALALPEAAAVTIARAFAGFEIPFDSPDMGDVIGEIVNVIAGDVAGRLAKKGLTAQMSLPSIARGSDVTVLVPSGSFATRFAFAGPEGRCRFDLVSNPPPAPSPAPAPAVVAKSAAPAAPKTAAEEALAAWAAAEAEAERELAEQDAAEAALRAAGGGAPAAQPSAASSHPTGPARPPRRKLLFLTLVFACGGWGAAAGLLMAGKRHPVPAEPAPTAHGPAPSAAPQPPAAQIDGLIRGGRFTEALELCLDAPKKAPGLSEPALALREALCLEGKGQWTEAALSYQRAEADPNVVAKSVTLLGQARCATQDGSYVLAKAFTNRVLLRSAHPAFRGLPVREEVSHLRARIDRQAAGAAPLPRDATARPLLSASACNCIDWLAATAGPAPGRDMVEVHRTLGAPGALQVTVGLAARPTIAMLRAVAATAGWKVQANDRAVAVLSRDLGAIEVDHLPLPEFLDVLLEGTGVAWAVQADVLVLTARK